VASDSVIAIKLSLAVSKASAGFLQMAMRGQKKGRRIGEQIAAWGGSRLTDDFLNGERYLKDADVTRRFLESLPRNGHRSEVQNYGIVGQTLWAFTEQHARKYPISDLDLPATKAANEQRGVEFVVPELWLAKIPAVREINSLHTFLRAPVCYHSCLCSPSCDSGLGH